MPTYRADVADIVYHEYLRFVVQTCGCVELRFEMWCICTVQVEVWCICTFARDVRYFSDVKLSAIARRTGRTVRHAIVLLRVAR